MFTPNKDPTKGFAPANTGGFGGGSATFGGFGAKPASNNNNAGADAKSSGLGGFNFGAGAGAAKAADNGAKPAFGASTSGFGNFGKSATTADSKPSFGGGGASGGGAGFGGGFGAKLSDTSASSSTAGSKPSFGASSTGFGAKPANSESAPAKPSFGFSAAKSTDSMNPSASDSKPTGPFSGFGAPKAAPGTSAESQPKPTIGTATSTGFGIGGNTASTTIGFGAPKASDPSTSKETDSKPSFGGFAPKPTDTPSSSGSDSKTSNGGFGFGLPKSSSDATNKPSSSFGFGIKTTTTTTTTTTTDSSNPSVSSGTSASDSKTGDAKPLGFGLSNVKDAKSSSTAGGATGFGGFSLPTPSEKKDGKDTLPLSSTSSGTGSNLTSGGLSTTVSTQPASAEYSISTVDGIISKWENQLRKDLEEYQRQSERVAMWDQQLRENQKMLNGLMDSVHRILADQEDLDGCIEAIEAYQRELDTELDTLSVDVDKYLESVPLEPDEGTYAREQIYSLAIDLDQHLTAINVNLDKIIEGYNEGKNGAMNETLQSSAHKSGANKIIKILKILNTHQDSLSWIDSKSKQLQKDVLTVSRRFDNSQGNGSYYSSSGATGGGGGGGGYRR